VITRGIREFMSRDWQAARDNKDMYWAERIARLGPVEAFRIAEELRQQALRQHPHWPDPSQREEDLRFHVRLAQMFRRAGSTRRA
jgi:hypothetical protein